MWKRDVARAFRKIAVAAEHLELSWVAFIYKGVKWAAQHTAMPFGTVSAVYSWHRVGAFLLAIVLRTCRAPAARFVDEFSAARGHTLCGREASAEVYLHSCWASTAPHTRMLTGCWT